jgi:hypothetical protein
VKRVVVAALALALPAPAAAAPPAKLVGKLVAPERLPDDRFGAALAVDGARGVASSPEGDVGIHDAAGRLHALALVDGAWTVAGDIDASTGSGPGRRLGAHAAIVGGTAVIGAPGYFNGGTFAGAIYVLTGVEPDTWVTAAVVGPPQPAVDTNFGVRVAAASGRALASRFQAAPEPPGRVYAFVEENPGAWSMTQTIEAPDPAPGDRFGLALAVAGTQALIGAPGADMARGAAYLFQWTDQGWAFATKLVAPERKPDDRFGAAVAIDGGVVLVGAPGSAKDTGAAWVFELEADSWIARPPLVPPDLAARGLYGDAVALDLPYAVVTAVDHDLDPENPEAGGRGRASWFGRAGGGAWVELATLAAADGVPGDRLGSSVALAGDHALLGAPGDDDDLGSVYVFRLEQLDGSPCVGDPECQAGLCCDGVCADACDPAATDGSSGDVITGGTDPTGTLTSGLPPLDLDPAANDGCACSSRHGKTGSPWISLVLVALGRPRRRARGRS